MIPLADGDFSNEARAISADGLWVSGFMGSGVMTYSPGVSVGYLYDVASGTVYCPVIDSTPSAYAGTLTGIARRFENGTNEVIVSGGASTSIDVPQWYMTFDGGTNWGDKFRDSRGASAAIPTANEMAGTESDIFYTTWTDRNPSGYQLYVGEILGPWSSLTTNWIKKGIPNGQQANLDSVSGTGRAVGWRWLTGASYRNNYVIDYNVPGGSGSPLFNFNGLAGTTEGEAFCVSIDGNVIFGRSPIITFVTELHAYKALFFGPYATNGTTLASLGALPHFFDTGGSTSLDAPYGCTPDGKYAVGMNYRGTEKAVVWDTSNEDTNKWTVLDLTELAKLCGIAGEFDGNLRRAYSVGTNAQGLVVTGSGVSVGVTRAFVMTVPLPIAPQLTIAKQGGWFQVDYLGLGNATNVLEYTTNLSLPNSWVPLDTNMSGSVTTYYDSAPVEAQKYYRVLIQ